jgi:hypothetical protein
MLKSQLTAGICTKMAAFTGSIPFGNLKSLCKMGEMTHFFNPFTNGGSIYQMI